MCLYPRLAINRKYTETKKNGGIVPPIRDIRTMYVSIGCNNCLECRQRKSREWQVRLQEEIKTSKNGKFVTLTFSNESIKILANTIHEKTSAEIIELRNQPKYDDKIRKRIDTIQKKQKGYGLDNAIATQAVRYWLERYRKENKTSIKHWLITELGHSGTENIHIHGIIWTDEPEKIIKDTWQYGHVWIGKYVNEKTINYITKYVTKVDKDHKYYKGIILTSHGIGKKYTEKESNVKQNEYKEKTNETYRTRQGTKIALPIYYRNKIYNEEEREKLWVEKLNRETRYVLGAKIDISQGMETYKQQLKAAQEKNKRLGFGDGSKDWKRERYEEAQRIIMQKTRIEKAKK